MSILTGRDTKTWLAAAGVIGAAGLLYFLTAARDVVVGDTPELITAAATLGVAHEPGYPLFTMLGHLFSLLPFGSIPFRVNLLSVACDSLTVGMVWFTALRLTRSLAASGVAALLLAFNPTFWAWSLVAEVFPLNNLLAALLIYLLVIWREQPDRSRFLIGAFFVAGLALTNHHTIILLAPAFCYVLWYQRALLKEHVGLVALCAVAFLIGLVPYVYLPWASAHHPAYNWGNISSINDFIAVITRRSYGGGHLVSTANYRGGSGWVRIGALLSSFGPITGGLTLLGAIAAYQRERWYFWFTIVAFVFVGPLFAWISDLNIATAPSALFVLQRFFLLSQVVLAPLMAFGVLWIAAAINRRAARTAIFALPMVTAVGLAVIAMLVLMNYRRIDQSRNFIERRFAEDLFATVESDSILLARGDIAFAIMYFQKVENTGKDATLVLLPLMATEWYVSQLRQEHPDLNIPFSRYDATNNNLKKFVEANSDRAICIAGTIGNDDRSLEGDYWPYQRGLLLVIEPKSKSIPLQEMIEQNQRLLSQYRPPSADAIRANTFEKDILTIYAWPAFRIGSDCERVGLKPEARQWYERALHIDPQFPQAREALARLGL